MARTVVAMWLPRTMAAAARRSSIRELVQEPKKTASTLISSMGVPGLRSMYSRARSKDLRSVSFFPSSMDGTFASMDVTIPGEVPQVTRGASTVASIFSSRS
jgi:hypothetical protein